jgi:hypothetical protein
MSVLTVAITLIVAGVVVVTLLQLFVNRPDIVAGLILGLQILGVAVDPEYLPALSAGEMSVYLADVVFAVVALAACVRVLATKRLIGAQVAILLAGLFTAIAVYRGISIVGLQQAVNEARPSFYFLTGVAYFMTVVDDNRMIERIGRIFLAAAGLLSVVVVILWIASLSGSPVPKPLATPAEFGGFRVIGAGQAMIIAFALLMALPRMSDPKVAHPLGRLRYLAFLLLPISVLVQHRTVWVALAVGLLILAARRHSNARSRALGLIGATALVVLTLGLLLRDQNNALTESLGRSTDTHTFEWRYVGWIDLLEGRQAPEGLDILIGTPYGLGYEREVLGIQEDVSPHNYYLETYLRHGLIGLGALLLAFGLSVAALVRLTPRTTPLGLGTSDVLLALMATQLLYLFTYGPSPDQGIIAGIIIGGATTANLMTRRSSVLPASQWAGQFSHDRPHVQA